MTIISEFRGEYRFLSNFWPAEVALDGLTYPTVEHAYQAAKFTDPALRARLAVVETPGEAKRLGRDRRPTTRDWKSRRVEIMRDLLRQKFSLSDLRDKLLATGDAVLQEGNRWGDLFWGVDLQTKDGENVLGKLLMEIRSELRGTSV